MYIEMVTTLTLDCIIQACARTSAQQARRRAEIVLILVCMISTRKY